jgi:hypothetical protein
VETATGAAIAEQQVLVVAGAGVSLAATNESPCLHGLETADVH